MNPTITCIPKTETHPLYYLVVFDTMADRSRWLLKRGFTYDPNERNLARWTCPHNGPDLTHSLELVPFAVEHAHNIRALCMRLYGHSLKPSLAPPPKRRTSGRVVNANRGMSSQVKGDNSSNEARAEIDALLGTHQR